MQNESNPIPVIAPASVLVINPGSTSTKFGVFDRQGPLWVTAVKHDDAELEQFRGRSALAQAGYRAALIEDALRVAGYDLHHFAAVAGRGGRLPPMACGTWLVDDEIRGTALCSPRRACLQPRRRPRSPLRPVAGRERLIADPVTVDEWQDRAAPFRPAAGAALKHGACAEHQGGGAAVCAGAADALRGAAPDRDSPGQRHHRLRAPRRKNDRQQHAAGRAVWSRPYGVATGAGAGEAVLQRQLQREATGPHGVWRRRPFAYLCTRDLCRSGAPASTQEEARGCPTVYEAMIYQIAKKNRRHGRRAEGQSGWGFADWRHGPFRENGGSPQGLPRPGSRPSRFIPVKMSSGHSPRRVSPRPLDGRGRSQHALETPAAR